MTRPVTQKIFRGTVFITIATVLSRLGVFTGNLLVIQYLGRRSVGEWNLAETFLTITTMVSLFGVGIAASKYIPHYLERDPRRAGQVTAVALVFALVAGLLVGAVVYVGLTVRVFPALQEAQFVLRQFPFVFSLLVALSTLDSTASMVIYGYEAFQSLIPVNGVMGLLSFPTLYFLAHWRGLAGVMEARTLLVGIEMVLLLVVLHRIMRGAGVALSLRNFRANVREMASFGFPTFLGHVPVNPVHAVMQNFLASQAGGFSQLGLFSAAQRLTGVVAFLPVTMTPTLTPILAGEWGRGETAGFSDGSMAAMRVFLMITLPITVFFMGASHFLLGHLYGQQFEVAWALVAVLLVVLLLSTCNDICDRTFTAAGKVWISSANNYVWAGVFLAGALLLIPRGLALGYVFAWLVAHMVYTALQFWWARRLFSLQLEALLPLFAVAVVVLPLAVLLPVSLGSRAAPVVSALLAVATMVCIARFCISASERRAVARQIGALGVRFGGLVGQVKDYLGSGL